MKESIDEVLDMNQKDMIYMALLNKETLGFNFAGSDLRLSKCNVDYCQTPNLIQFKRQGVDFVFKITTMTSKTSPKKANKHVSGFLSCKYIFI
jgi:hypothetical protein